MSEKISGDTQVINSPLDRLPRNLLIGGVTWFAAMALNETPAHGISDGASYDGINAQVEMSSFLSTKTGRSGCDVSISSTNTIYNSFTLVLRIERQQQGEWVTSPNFIQKESFTPQDESPESVEGRVRGSFGVAKLQRESKSYPTRLACDTGETNMSVRLPHKLFL